MDKEKRYQEVVFTQGRYSWRNTPEEAKALMWKDISEFLQILFQNDYIVVIYQEESDIVVVQFEHDERCDAWGCANPYWITEEEYFDLKDLKGEFDEDDEYTVTE
jgi:hypothetical protein